MSAAAFDCRHRQTPQQNNAKLPPPPQEGLTGAIVTCAAEEARQAQRIIGSTSGDTGQLRIPESAAPKQKQNKQNTPQNT